MKKFACLLLTAVGSLIQSQAAAFDYCGWGVDFGVDTGFRYDKIHINSTVGTAPLAGFPAGDIVTIAATNSDRWRDLESWTFGGYLRVNTPGNLYLRSYLEWGNLFQGRHENLATSVTTVTPGIPTILTTNIIGSSRSRGDLWDFDISLGYNFHFWSDRVTLAPIIGWSYDYTRVHDRSFIGLETVALSALGITGTDIFTGPILGVTNQKLRWTGPFIGFDLGYQLTCNWTVLGGYEFHWARFCGHFSREAVTTLTTATAAGVTTALSPPPFTGTGLTISQRADRAHGQKIWLGAEYVFDEGCDWGAWTFGLSGNYSCWRTQGNGHIKETGSNITNISIPAPFSISIIEPLGAIANRGSLDKVTWTSWSIDLDVGYEF